MSTETTIPQPSTLEDVPDALNAMGWNQVAVIFLEMQEALAEYARAHHYHVPGRETPFAEVSEASRLAAMRHGRAVMRREREAEEGA